MNVINKRKTLYYFNSEYKNSKMIDTPNGLLFLAKKNN